MEDTARIVAEMQTYYSRRAPIYDQSMGYDDPSAVDRFRRVVDSLRRQLAGQSVLEIACGPCFWTGQYAAAARSITALDYNESTLAEARRKPLDWTRVSLMRGDAYAPPFAPSAFDACVAVDWLAHVPKSRLAPFLRSLHASLRAGARVVFCDQLPSPDSESGLYDTEGNHLQERTLPDGARYRVIKHFPSEQETRVRFAPYCERVDIESFPECRRVVVGYTLLRS
jgi:SAM-dependent methyltransferase